MSDDATTGAAPGVPGGSATPAEPIVRAEGLTKTHYGEGLPVHAVRGVDLSVRPGEFVAVTGPSEPENPPCSTS